MKVSIEIDTNKIDYEKISEQIADKLKNADISEIVTDSLIESMIRDIIYSKVVYAFDDYLKNDLEWLDSKGNITQTFKLNFKKYIEDIYKENIGDRLAEEVNHIDKESIQNAIIETTPNILISIIREYCTGMIYSLTDTIKEQAFKDAKGLLKYSFNSVGTYPDVNIDRNTASIISDQ